MWSLTVKCLNHIGHIRSTDQLQHRQFRRLTNEEYNWVQRHYRDSKPRLLVELFEKRFGRQIRRQDMYNTIGSIRRHERCGYADFQLFIRELEQGPDIKWFDVDYIQGPDQTKRYRYCSWIFSSQVELWKRYPGCFSIDATYRTNTLHWPLILVVVVTPVKTVLPIFQALLSSEQDKAYNWLTLSIKKAASELAIQLPSVVLTDGDAQLARALQTTFPEAFCQRCIFHKAKNVIDYIKKEWLRPALARVLQEFHGEAPIDNEPGDDIEETEEEIQAAIAQLQASKANVDTRRENLGKIPDNVANTRSGLYLLWEHMAYSASKHDFEAAWSQLQARFSAQKKIIDYLKGEYEHREQWAGYCTRQQPNFGCRTTSPNESSNGSIKSYGLSASCNLSTVLATTKRFVDDRISTYRDRLNSSRERVVMEYLDMRWLGASPPYFN